MGDRPTTETQNVVPTTPEQMKPYVDQVLQDSQGLYEERLNQGYQPYSGQTIAGFTPEEVASQQGLKSLIGTQAPLQQEALNLARGTDREFTADTAQQYMSPYLRTALDAQKAQAQRQYESTIRPQFEAAAVRAGGMSGLGSRAAVQAAEMDSNQQRMLADIEATGQEKAYQAALQLFQDQTNRERQASSQISTASPNIYKANLQDMGLLSQIGEDKRELAQGVLDEAYSKYITRDQFPESTLARYQSSIYGAPLLKQKSYDMTGTKSGGGPSTGKTLLGLGAGILGFGTGGGNQGNTVGGDLFKWLTKKSGGGISSAMKAQPYVQYMNRRAVGGLVHDGKVTTFEEYNRAEREAQALAGLQQEASPVLSTPASAVATAPAPAMASAAPTGLPAAMPPAAMPPALDKFRTQTPGGEDGKKGLDFGPDAEMPWLNTPKNPENMPLGFRQGSGATASPAMELFTKYTTGEKWSAPYQGYIPAEGWVSQTDLDSFGFKRAEELAENRRADYITPRTPPNKAIDQDMLITGNLGMAPLPSGFTHPTGPVTMARVPFWNPTTGEEWTAPTGGYIPPPGWERKSAFGNELRRTDGTENQPMPEYTPMPEPEYTYDKSRGGFKDVNGKLAIDPNTALYGWLEDDEGSSYFDQQAFLRDAYNANISGGLRGGLGRHNFIQETQNENEGELYYNYNLARNVPPVSMKGGTGVWGGNQTTGLQSLNRRGGGRVMPPVMYRQQAGTVMPTGTVTRDEIGNVVSPLNMPPAMATDQRDFDAQYASDMEKGGETPYGLSGLDSATDESAFAQPLAPTVDKPTTLTPLSSDQSGAATLDNAFKMIGDKLTIDFPALTAGVRKQYTDDNITSEKEIVALNKESSDFQKRSIARIDNYKNDVISLTGNDPNENRNFWFTVAAAIMKPGNAWANLAQGLKEATLASSASREKKNKLLMMISKDEMNFKNDLDKIASASTRSSIKLNAKQERTLNSLPKAIRDEVMKFLLAGYKYNVAVAKARKESKAGKKDKSFRSMLLQGEAQIAKDYGFIIDKDGNLGVGKGSPTLDSPLYQQMLKRQTQFRKLYTDKLDALESTSDAAQLEAYRYATKNTDLKSAISSSGGKRVDIFSNKTDANRIVQADKDKYLGRTIQIGGTKFKVTDSGFEQVK